MQREKVIIVGGGTSGMAAASCLTKQSIPYIILEREDCSASMWKKYTYDRLHLHLVKRVCELPFFPFPNSYPNYVPRKLFVEYLETYEKHFDMKILYHRCVVLAEYDEAEQIWRVKAQNRSTGEVEEYGGRFLVVASGEDKPHVPRVEGLESFRGRAIHSTSYRNGKEYRDEHVLVVGSGNSGMEIALDLANFGAKPSIVARTPEQVHFLSRNMMNYGSLLLWYLSTETVEKLLAIVSRIVYGDLSKYGLPFPSEGPFTMKRKYGKFPVIDLGTIKKIKSGEIQVVPTEIESIRGNEVLFRGGKSFPFDSIIFCTGFKRTTQKWLKGGEDLLNEDGFPCSQNQWKGKNGLYCVGMGRAGFYGANAQAQNIANDIVSLDP
ncbi:indole-3-pyruvate monooxygenase [Vigna angularis]|uniref:Flavin-containing monooxygenase n=1 Tax=Phaseolus angularis TaxID=3914 RepID=A0A8T0L9D5_PHAAN|nr:indole-3-pyruvate monooxygenase [Vigna angularis]